MESQLIVSNTARQGVVVLGATSPIARAAAVAFAKQGYDLVVGARDEEENALIARDIEIRCGVRAHAVRYEAEDFDSHADLVEQCRELLPGGIAGVLLGQGFMDAQELAQSDFAVARRTLDVNFTACVSICERFAALFEANKGAGRPFIAVISSVAGDRGRQSNYIYGASKAGLSAYLEGLRNRLFHKGIAVLTVKPGFVDTRMTFAKNVKMAAPPETVGQSIAKAALAGKDIIYLPWPWRYIMLIIRHIPETVFKRLKM